MPLNPLTQALFELKDDNYREFHAKLIPNVPAEKIIACGLRLCVTLRKRRQKCRR